MKMTIKKLALVSLLLAFGGVSYGASIDHIQNYTPEYNANPAQQGAISAGTSAYYNPAGLMQIENGRYFHVGAQLATGTETMKYDGQDYEADLMDVVPNFAYIDKNDERAYYWIVGGIAGGAELEYENGVPGIALIQDVARNGGTVGGITLPQLPDAQITENWAQGSNKYVQSTMGRAWFLTENLSFSAAGRVVYGIRTLEGKLGGDLMPGAVGDSMGLNGLEASIDSERTAFGYGGVFGLNYKASEKLNLGMRYDTRINMNFESDTDEDFASVMGSNIGFSTIFGQYADGVKERRDLPAILAMGASYKATDRWTVYAGGNYYFNKDAKLDEEYTEGDYDNGWELSLGSEYQLNQKWAWLLGANYAVTGADEETYSDIEYAIDSFMLGTGFKYRYNENTEIVAAVNHYWYSATDGTHYSKAYGVEDARYDKSITAMGVSLTKKF